MKISLDIDCTPDELRGFFGLPDVRPMQEELLKEAEERMRAGLKSLDPRASSSCRRCSSARWPGAARARSRGAGRVAHAAPPRLLLRCHVGYRLRR